jgi:hypothetical protein
MVKEGPQGTTPVSIHLSDYREVDGVKMPFESKLTNPAFTMVFKITDVKHNVPIDDAKFAKPVPAPAK